MVVILERLCFQIAQQDLAKLIFSSSVIPHVDDEGLRVIVLQCVERTFKNFSNRVVSLRIIKLRYAKDAHCSVLGKFEPRWICVAVGYQVLQNRLLCDLRHDKAIV